MEDTKTTIQAEIENWLEDYAPADQIEKCAAQIEKFILSGKIPPISNPSIDRSSEVLFTKEQILQIIGDDVKRKYKTEDPKELTAKKQYAEYAVNKAKLVQRNRLEALTNTHQEKG